MIERYCQTCGKVSVVRVKTTDGIVYLYCDKAHWVGSLSAEQYRKESQA